MKNNEQPETAPDVHNDIPQTWRKTTIRGNPPVELPDPSRVALLALGGIARVSLLMFLGGLLAGIRRFAGLPPILQIRKQNKGCVPPRAHNDENDRFLCKGNFKINSMFVMSSLK